VHQQKGKVRRKSKGGEEGRENRTRRRGRRIKGRDWRR
jgi:hypothetical protein